MNKEIWLEMRQDELNRALELQSQGNTLIWCHEVALDIQEYIDDKKSVIIEHLNKKVKE